MTGTLLMKEVRRDRQGNARDPQFAVVERMPSSEALPLICCLASRSFIDSRNRRSAS